MHVELVRIHSPLHYRLAQAIGGGDEHHIVEARLGIHGEHDAGGTGVGANHALNARRQGDVGMGETLVYAVGDCSVVVERGKNFLDRVQDVFVAVNVEEGLLLPGKGSVRKVLRGRRGAHGERGAGAAGGDQLLVVGLDLRFQRRRERGVDHPLADLRADPQQRFDVVDIEPVQGGIDPLGQTLVGEEFAVSGGRGGESARHPNTGGGQLADHFAERSILPAHVPDIGHAQVVECNYVPRHVTLPY